MKVLLMGDESYTISSRMGLKEVCKEKYVSFVEHKESAMIEYIKMLDGTQIMAIKLTSSLVGTHHKMMIISHLETCFSKKILK
jgi:hypothetical protein